MKNAIGIDPGISNGGIAIMLDNKLLTFKMPQTFTELYKLLEPYKHLSCSVEKIQRRTTNNRFIDMAMQPLYENYTTILNVLQMLGIKYNEIHPQTWQSGLNLKQKYEKGIDYRRMLELKSLTIKTAQKELEEIKRKEKQTRKNRYKAFAKSLFPQYKITNWNADAILLMVYEIKFN